MSSITTDPDGNPVDPTSGYCPVTRTFHSVRPPPPLPPPSLPLSVADYVISLLHTTTSASSSSSSSSSSLDDVVFLIDSSTGRSLTYSHFLSQVHSLKNSLPPIKKGHVALILSPPSFTVPVLYFALLSLGVVVSPSNPLATEAELTHLVRLVDPVIAFVVSSAKEKLPRLPLGVVVIDSPEFDSLLTRNGVVSSSDGNKVDVVVNQSDSATILYSSGTTGRVKGVEATHRNYISLVSGLYHNSRRKNSTPNSRTVSLFTLPLFHVFGFFMMLKSVAMADTLVLMPKFDFENMLRAIERFRVSYVPVSPPLVVAMVKSELTERYELGSLEGVGCGGAPLGKDVVGRFQNKFPHVLLVQGYGLTETVGSAATMREEKETERCGSVGLLFELMEAKIVDTETGEALPQGQTGELWLRGPLVMKGYVGDKNATTTTLDADGWLKTGDLCYFDPDGFLYIVDRLKELIKYKGYQVPPAELERTLLSHPEIADAAVVPYPDEDAGQIPMAYVVRKDGSNITGDYIMDFVAKQVAPYKKIRRVSFIDSIPKNPAGKILRRLLANHAVSGRSARL